jgi:electron transfer flavoprotein alpha subunit
MSGVWVWVENKEGQIPAVSREAIGAARKVADSLGQSLTGLVFGQDVAGVAETAFALGVDAVLGSDDATLANFRVEAYGPLAAQLAQERNPSVLIIGGSTRGRDLSYGVEGACAAGLLG